MVWNLNCLFENQTSEYMTCTAWICAVYHHHHTQYPKQGLGERRWRTIHTHTLFIGRTRRMWSIYAVFVSQKEKEMKMGLGKAKENSQKVNPKDLHHFLFQPLWRNAQRVKVDNNNSRFNFPGRIWPSNQPLLLLKVILIILYVSKLFTYIWRPTKPSFKITVKSNLFYSIS